MNLSSEGLSLWYGTPDAPAPDENGVVPREGTSLVVGVKPANPTNSLEVRYRVDGGIEQRVPGREIRTDYARQAQYFGVSFPRFVTGDVVEYSPVLTAAGRQVPAPAASHYPSRFRLGEKTAAGSTSGSPAQPAARAADLPGRLFAASLDFVAYVAVQFQEPPQYIGDTAEGMRVNFFVTEGVIEGEGLKGKVVEYSSDHLTVRRDGMGEIRIRAAFQTSDGATLDIESGGYVDFGAEGYRRALAHDLPDRAPLVVTPLVTTRHPRYRWLSRVQCVGVGYTHLAAGQVNYFVYSTSTRRLT